MGEGRYSQLHVLSHLPYRYVKVGKLNCVISTEMGDIYITDLVSAAATACDIWRDDIVTVGIGAYSLLIAAVSHVLGRIMYLNQ